MSETSETSELEGSPKLLPPLGLPAGSVRALLTLIVVAVVIANVVQERSIDLLWIETLLIALAHYFTARRFVELPEKTVTKLKSDGVIQDEHHPLFLPRHSIRFLIVAAFVGLAVYLYREQRFDTQAVSLLGIVFIYVAGSIIRRVTTWWNNRRPEPPSRIWRDLRAIVVLGTLVVAAIPEFLNQPDLLVPEVHKVALGMMLFYFGSR